MIAGHGIDIVEIERIRKLLDKYGNGFLEKFFTPYEIERARKERNPAPYVASRFAAKEAFSKSIGTGFRGFGLSDISVLREEGKPPSLLFSEKLHSLIPDLREEDFLLSISHEKNYAIASVIWQKQA